MIIANKFKHYLSSITIPKIYKIHINFKAVIVDMEEGVINNMLKSDIGELFDDR